MIKRCFRLRSGWIPALLRCYNNVNSYSGLRIDCLARVGVVSTLCLLSLVACVSSDTIAPTLTLSSVDLGQEVYIRVCADCHGENGNGYANELGAPALDSTEHASHHPDQQIYDWIANGKLSLEREMPALGDQLTHNEILEVIVYLHTLWTEEQLADQQSITERYPVTLEPRQKP